MCIQNKLTVDLEITHIHYVSWPNSQSIYLSSSGKEVKFEIDDTNRQIAQEVFKQGGYAAEHPLTRNWWCRDSLLNYPPTTNTFYIYHPELSWIKRMEHMTVFHALNVYRFSHCLGEKNGILQFIELRRETHTLNYVV